MHRQSPIEELQKELHGAHDALRERHRLAREIDRLDAHRLELDREIDELNAAIGREQDDVDRLQSTALVTRLYALIGALDSRLERERQEVLAAELQRDVAVRQRLALDEELALTRARMIELANSEAECDRIERAIVGHLRSNPAAFELLDPPFQQLFDGLFANSSDTARQTALTDGDGDEITIRVALDACRQARDDLLELRTYVRESTSASNPGAAREAFEPMLSALAVCQSSMRAFSSAASELGPFHAHILDEITSALVRDFDAQLGTHNALDRIDDMLRQLEWQRVHLEWLRDKRDDNEQVSI